MKSAEFQKFIDLVNFDQEIVKIERDIVLSEEKIEDLFSQINKIQKDFDQLKQIKHDAVKAVDQQELDMKALDDEEQAIAAKQETLHNQREYKALEKELLQLQADRLGKEKDLIDLWNNRENVEKQYAEEYPGYEKSIQELESSVDEVQEQIKDLQVKLEESHNARSEKTSLVPEKWLKMYATMQGRVSDPVVKVVQDSCEACFYPVTTRDLQQLKRHEMLQCKDCYRILYYDTGQEMEA